MVRSLCRASSSLLDKLVSSVLVLVLVNDGVRAQPASTAATAISVLESSNFDPCPSYVSEVNTRARVSAFLDTTCVDDTKGVGCFANSCRFCREDAQGNEISKFFVACDPEIRRAEADGGASKGSQAFEAAPDCAGAISVGDRNAGVSAFFDAGCPWANGGIGCQANQCRFCKTRDSPQSRAFVDCPTTTTDTTTVDCPTAAAAAAASQGLTAYSWVSEAKCNVPTPRLIGCVASTPCQLCRTTKNENNQRLVSCKVLQDMKQESAAAAAMGAAPESEPMAATAQLSVQDESFPEDDDAADAKTSSDGDATDFGSRLELQILTGVGALAAVALAVMAIRLTRAKEEVVETPREFQPPLETGRCRQSIARL